MTMARKRTKKKPWREFQCPARFPKSKKRRGPVEPCWRAERAARFKHSGYVTAFYDRSTGRLIGYGKGFLTTGKNIQQICGVSRDPFRAVILNDRSSSAIVGELCIRLAKHTKKKGKGG